MTPPLRIVVPSAPGMLWRFLRWFAVGLYDLVYPLPDDEYRRRHGS